MTMHYRSRQEASINTCYLCRKTISGTNDSKEHIIPNSIGGRRKVKGFICLSCNSNSGNTWENELTKQFNPLSLFFGITRERGTVPSQRFQTTGGQELVLNIDGSLGLPTPEFKESIVDAGVEIHIRARTMTELRKMLSGVAKKYPQLDFTKSLDQIKSQSSYCSDKLHFSFSFGGTKAGRSLVKSALAQIATLRTPIPECRYADEYLLSEDGNACFGFYYEKDLVKNRPEGIPFHCVHVEGKSDTNEILAYVEYFGLQRVVMLLSDNYEGDSFETTYALNPQDGTELELNISIDLTKQEIFEAYNYKKIPEGSVKNVLSKLIETRMKQQKEQHHNDVLEKSATYAFENCGAKYGEIMTPAHRQKMIELMMEKLDPYLIHQIRGSRRTSDA